MTDIQIKIKSALDLLVEVRVLAAAQGRAFTEAHDRPKARMYERMAADLQDNVGISLESLTRWLETESLPTLPACVEQSEFEKSSVHLYRRINQKTKRETKCSE